VIKVVDRFDFADVVGASGAGDARDRYLERLEAAINFCADTSGSENQYAFIGEAGVRLMIRRRLTLTY
jgi:hypothetical protein